MKKDNRGKKPKTSIQDKIKKFHKDDSEYRYLYHIPAINQKAVIDNEWDLDIVDLTVFYAIKSFILSKKCIKTTENNVDWYYIKEEKILSDVPLLPLASASAVSKRINNLCKFKLLERKSDNKETGRKLLRLGDNYELMIYTKNEA